MCVSSKLCYTNTWHMLYQAHGELGLNESVQVPFYPPVQQLEQFTDAFCKDLILKASGLDELHIVVKSVRSWTMSAQVAETFQVTVTPAVEASTPAMQPSCIRRASPWPGWAMA